MARKGGIMQDDNRPGSYFAGPLNLNRNTRQADTVMGTKLVLDADTCEALDMLVVREGEPLTFEQLYEAVWDKSDGVDNREAALTAMNDLVGQIGSVGEGFMVIEVDLESIYTFRTRWGHNWQREIKPAPAHEHTIISPSAKPGRVKGTIAALLAGVGVVAAIAVLVLLRTIGTPAHEEFTITDSPLPMAEPGFINGIVYPEVDTFIINGARDVALGLYNPKENKCHFIFELAFADTREIVYISELTAPGEHITNAVFTRELTAGEYRMVLYIRAYGQDGHVEIDNERLDITIIVG